MKQDRDRILAEITRTVKLNGGQPLGQKAFYTEARVNRTVLQRAGFANYGAALKAAGIQPNTLKTAFTDDQLFEPLARLARELGHFPTTNERQVERYKNPSFPGYRSLARRGSPEELRSMLLSWCSSHPDFSDLAQLLGVPHARPARPKTSARPSKRAIHGYVYLMRYGAHGKDYKLGYTENVARRHAQLNMMSPDDIRQVHVIETDDPKGIEEYWQKRWADKRIKTKEVFRLTPEDVAAFKWRQYQ